MIWPQEEAGALISRLLVQLMKSDKYGERRGAAFGLAGVVKGFGISCLKKYNVTTALRDGLSDRSVFVKPLVEFFRFYSITACMNISKIWGITRVND